MRYAENTSISVSRSKGEIEDILLKYGATGFMSGSREDKTFIAFEIHNKAVKFTLPLPDRDSFKRAIKWGVEKDVSEEAAYKAWEQACRQRWRALALCIKAKLEAVECGITSFEEEFLAHFVMKNGQTLGQMFLPQLEKHYETGAMPKLLGM